MNWFAFALGLMSGSILFYFLDILARAREFYEHKLFLKKDHYCVNRFFKKGLYYCKTSGDDYTRIKKIGDNFDDAFKVCSACLNIRKVTP